MHYDRSAQLTSGQAVAWVSPEGDKLLSGKINKYRQTPLEEGFSVTVTAENGVAVEEPWIVLVEASSLMPILDL